MSTSSITNRQDLLMISLTDFFCKDENINILLPILKSNCDISLRIIDWYVTNYSKKQNEAYTITRHGKKKRFNVYINYKSQLKAYSKKQFDPFCRRERIQFFYKKGEYIITTVGQLNFFRWAIQNKIIDHVKNQLKVIEEDMNHSIKNIYCSKAVTNVIKKSSKIRPKNKSKRRPKEHMTMKYGTKRRTAHGSKRKKDVIKNRKKRKELSKAATKKINRHKSKSPIIITFE